MNASVTELILGTILMTLARFDSVGPMFYVTLTLLVSLLAGHVLVKFERQEKSHSRQSD
jgi:hypothetical protein